MKDRVELIPNILLLHCSSNGFTLQALVHYVCKAFV